MVRKILMMLVLLCSFAGARSETKFYCDLCDREMALNGYRMTFQYHDVSFVDDVKVEGRICYKCISKIRRI